MTSDTAHHSQPPRIRRQVISENNSGFESQKGLKQNLEINTQDTRCQNYPLYFSSTLEVKQNEHNCKRDPIYSEYR